MYERQMSALRSQLLSPGTPSFPLQMFDASRLTPTSSAGSIQRKYQQWAQERWVAPVGLVGCFINVWSIFLGNLKC